MPNYYISCIRSHLVYANIVNVIWSGHHICDELQRAYYNVKYLKTGRHFLHKDNFNRHEDEYVLRPYKERCVESGFSN